MLEKTNKGEGCFEWRSLRSTGVNRSDTIRAHGNALQACMTGLIPAQPSFLLAPVFPGCHVICRPATLHGIEPPPVLPSLDKRAGIEPALSLLAAGLEPAAFARRCSNQLNCTNIEAAPVIRSPGKPATISDKQSARSVVLYRHPNTLEPLRCWSSDISHIAYSHSGPRRMKRGVGGRI